MKLFDRKGRPVEVPDDQVHEALSSGQYGAPKGTRIPVKMDGQIGTVPIERLGTALAGDAEVVPQSVYDAAELQAQYGDAGHGALALGTEALDTATLGASNALIRGIGGKGAAKEVRKSQEANPFTTGVGTGIGIVGPVLADIASGGALTPELAAAVAERTAARTAERAAEGGIARHLLPGAERRLLGAGERAAAEEAAGAGAAARAPQPRRPIIDGVLEPPTPNIPISAEEEMLGEVVQPLARTGPSGAVRSAEGVLENGPRRLGAAPEEMLGEVVQPAPGLGGQAAPRALSEARPRSIPHNEPSVRPFSAEEVAEYQADLGVTPTRQFRQVPLSEIENQPVWEPAKIDALRKQLAETGKLDPVRLTRDGNGAWVIEDGVHRTALARELGMTHMPAVTTEYVPFVSSAEKASAAIRAESAGVRALPPGVSPRALPPGVPTIAPEIEAEILKDYGSLGTGRATRALPPSVAGDFESVGAQALHDVPELAGAVPPRMLPPGVAPEVVAAEEAARVERLTEAAKVVEQARSAGVAAERAAAEATGKGVIRQTVEGALFGPTRAVNFGGQLVEDAVRGVLGREAETALGRIAQDAVVKAARGAFEGGAYAVGSEAGHQFLQDDPDLSAERLSSAWFNGALLGGGFGAATGALGRGTKEAISKVVGNEGIAKYLSDKAGEHMWHAAGGTKKMAGNAEKYAGGVSKVGNLVREDAEQLMGRTPRTREELFELSQLMQTKHNASLDAVLNRLDEEAVGAGGLKLGDILKKVEKAEKELKARAAPHGQLTSFKERIVDALEARDALTGEVALGTPVTFKQLREFRRTADEASKFESTNPNAVRDSFRQLRHSFESEIEAAAEPHITKAGGNLLKDYKAAKAGYQAGKLLEKASGSGVAAERANQFTSLTDKLFGLGAGTVVGHAAGPIGGFMSHQIAGYASKQFRKNFDFVVSDVLAKLANVAKGAQVLDAAQAANVKVQKRMDQGMRSIQKGLDGKEIEGLPIVPGPKTYEERKALIINLASQHEEVMAHLNEATSPLSRAAPNIAGAVNTTALRTLTFLIEALPKPPSPPKDNLTPKAFDRDWEPADPQKAAFNRKYVMAVHPETAPALVAAGAYTVEHDQALTATHPKMKADMGAKLRATLDKRTKAVPASMRSSVKLFLGVPAVDKELGRMMQQNYAKQAAPQPKPRPLKLDTNLLTLP